MALKEMDYVYFAEFSLIDDRRFFHFERYILERLYCERAEWLLETL